MATINTESRNKKVRILLVDDHPLLRQGLVRLIERTTDLSVCGEAGSVEEAMEAAGRLQPELAVVDLALQGRTGLDLIKEFRKHYPRLQVIVLSMHDEALWAERVLRAGACGYVMKQEDPRTILANIRRAAKGETCLSAPMSETLLRKLRGEAGSKSAHAESELGDREMEVLQLIGNGMSTRDVAAALHISIKTVEAHREHIKQKLNLANATDLLRYAVLRFMSPQS